MNMAPIVLVSVVLMVYSTAVCACEENDLVVLTTASQLREEIRSELNQAGNFLRLHSQSPSLLLQKYSPAGPTVSLRSLLDQWN